LCLFNNVFDWGLELFPSAALAEGVEVGAEGQRLPGGVLQLLLKKSGHDLILAFGNLLLVLEKFCLLVL